MHKLILFGSITITLLSCNSDITSKKENISIEQTPCLNMTSLDSIPKTDIGEGAFFSFQFDVDSSRHKLEGFKVYAEGELIQSIIYKGNLFYEYDLIDWNFDGYKDISVLDYCGSGGCTYFIWNYIPQENMFKFNEKLSNVIGLERDTVNQWIIFHYRAGYREEIWNVNKYKGDTLFPVHSRFREKWIDTLGNEWKKNTSQELSNDGWLVKVDSFISN